MMPDTERPSLVRTAETASREGTPSLHVSPGYQACTVVVSPGQAWLSGPYMGSSPRACWAAVSVRVNYRASRVAYPAVRAGLR